MRDGVATAGCAVWEDKKGGGLIVESNVFANKDMVCT
jgi:hypothetical protein